MNHKVKIVELQFGSYSYNFYNKNNSHHNTPKNISHKEIEIARYLDEGYTIVAAEGSGGAMVLIQHLDLLTVVL